MRADIFIAAAVISFCLVSLSFAQEQNEPSKQTFGPRGIMDTSPIIEVPIEKEEPPDLEKIAAIPLEQRIAKYDTLLGDFKRKGVLTPYYKGQLLGYLNTNSAVEPNSIPYIWVTPGEAGKKIVLKDARSGNRPYVELELEGDGESAWISRAIPSAPETLYRLSVFASSSDSESELFAGVGYARRNWNDIGPPLKIVDERYVRHLPGFGFTRKSFIFLSSKESDKINVRLGPGKTGDTYRFHTVFIDPILPIYRGVQSSEQIEVKVIGGTSSFVGIPGGEAKNIANRGGDFLRLGDGEKIEKGRYEFSGTFEGKNGMFHRPLVSCSAEFDTDKFIFGENSELLYKFILQPIRVDEKPGDFTPKPLAFAEFELSASYLEAESKEGSLAWSLDGENWTEIPVVFDGPKGTITIPKTAVEKREAVFVRFRNTQKEKIAINAVAFTASIDSEQYSGEGKTVFAILENSDRHERYNGPPNKGCMMAPLMFSQDNALYKLFINESGTVMSFGSSYMDCSGSEDFPGGHGDGPGKWTIMSLGTKWGAAGPYRSRISIWAYNWFREANLFSFDYPGISFKYEIITPPSKKEEGGEQ